MRSGGICGSRGLPATRRTVYSLDCDCQIASRVAWGRRQVFRPSLANSLRMLTQRVWLISLLACAGTIALAAPLPVFWPLEVGTHDVGWRFRRDFASWPGAYWRGPGQPPHEAEPNVPATWGTLRLGGPCDAAPPPETAAWEVTAPLVEGRPTLDGMIGWQEWSGAASLVEPLEEGEQWLLLTQRNATTLFVCLAAPSVFAAHRGQIAEVYLAPPAAVATPPTASARVFRLRADRERQPVLESFVSDRGEWRERDNRPDDPLAWRGGAAGSGDGAWAYAVFEFAIPLQSLACEGVVPEQFLCMARLQTEGHGDDVVSPPNANPESVLWPDGRTSYNNATIPARRPDAWQQLALGAKGTPEGLQVPLAARPIRVDGQLGLREWQGAWTADYELGAGQWRRVMLVRDADKVYVAVRLHVARGPRQDESCSVYVDPCGDGGLAPRGDDVLFRVAMGDDAVPETLRYQPQGWRRAAVGEVAAAGFPLSAFESCYEMALPLTALGPTLNPKLAVEVAYRLP